MDRPEEKMDQIIFKVGGGQIVICASFYPEQAKIDSLFDETMQILQSELSLTKKELYTKLPNLDTLRDKFRLVAIKDLISRSQGPYGDPYEMVEYATDELPELKLLREADDVYQRNKIMKLRQADTLANFNDYEGALKIFYRFRNDPDILYRIFLCRLAMQDSMGARSILDGQKESSLNLEMMTNIYESYVNKNLEKFRETIAKRPEDMKDSFLVTILLRIRNLISS